ncbi:MAG: SAM-dependent methyltransferase [Lysobacterales bacterium CG_4_10_14_3_um_filter_64_11]|nr:MAG: SAM-dependent methyltransferase [Xanthomonadales bacterium CG_4_10_14_3_um_filter_64_11]
MSTPARSLQPETSQTLPLTLRLARTAMLSRLAGLRGELVLHDALGSTRLGQHDPSPDAPAAVVVHVRDPEFYRHVALNGSVGAGEAYMDGLWTCTDLVALIRLLVRNRDLLDAMEGGSARVAGWLLRAWHGLRRNTHSGARRNIAAHYDLGNPLFRLFLDENLMYSSAIFASQDELLEVAAERKLARICEKLDLRSSDHVVEIGTGWGGFALYAARRHGCHVTTTTISREQFELAQARVASAGLDDRVTVLFADYRTLRGRFDKLVSIEMVEAIGHQYLKTYFKKCADLLKPSGLAVIQAITIEDQRYQQALRSVDFIKRHIFPGSFIPCVSALVGSAARHTDLRLINLEDIGASYALTLQHWRQRFLEQREAVRALGYDHRFMRMWEFYLAYCEGGFIERSIGNVQLLFARPDNRRGQFSPPIAQHAGAQ